MEPQKLRTLKILEAVDNGDTPSQRDLARQLNISLGLVNSFIKRLVNKGYFKVTTIPRNRVRYILTPKGAAEKTKLTYEFIQYSVRFYKDARHKLKTIFTGFEQEGIKSVAFYGAGELAEIAYLSLQETSMSLVVILDDINKGKKFFGQMVKSFSNVSDSEFDKILVMGSDDSLEAKKKLLEAGIHEDKIVFLT